MRGLLDAVIVRLDNVGIDYAPFNLDAPRMTAEGLRGVLRWAVTSFYLRPGHAWRLLRCTPWSTLARQGTSVLGAAFDAHT